MSWYELFLSVIILILKCYYVHNIFLDWYIQMYQLERKRLAAFGIVNLSKAATQHKNLCMAK